MLSESKKKKNQTKIYHQTLLLANLGHPLLINVVQLDIVVPSMVPDAAQDISQHKLAYQFKSETSNKIFIAHTTL